MRILDYNLLRDSVVTASSSNDLFPVANLYSKRKAQEFRFTGKTSESILVNKTGLAYNSLVIDNHNLTDTARLVLQANTSDSWTDPAFEFESRKLPVAEYHFDGDLTDERGGANLTVASGSAVYESGVVGQGAGGGSFRATGITPGLAGSVSFWAKFDTFAPFSSLVYGNQDDSVNTIFLRQDDAVAINNSFDFFISDVSDGGYKGGEIIGNIILDVFSHIVITWDNGVVNVYQNKELIGSITAVTPGWYPDGQQFRLGVGYGDNGQVNDDFRIFDYALSQAEITALYNAPQQDLPPVMEITSVIYYGWDSLQDYDYFRVLIEDTDNTEPVKIGMMYLSNGTDFSILPGWSVDRTIQGRVDYRTAGVQFYPLEADDKDALYDILVNLGGTISLSATRQQFGSAWPGYFIIDPDDLRTTPIYGIIDGGLNLTRISGAPEIWDGSLDIQEVF